jgi:O-antigen ligase
MHIACSQPPMPPARSRSSAPSTRLKQFRGTRNPLPPGDKRVLIVLLVHLCFLPWALGTMHPWSQAVSLGLAAIGFIVALTAPRADRPETGDRRPEIELSSPRPEPDPTTSGLRSQVSGLSASLSGRSPVSRLLRFPPFWLGLALLAYIAVQALNPSWRYTIQGTRWWLIRLPDISWLPTSIEAPFAQMNVWRQFIIYASAWLTLCTVAIGLTRRRSFGVLLGWLTVNSLVLIVVGFAARLTRPVNTVLWFDQVRPRTISFSSFIYKNHAGAYLCLVAAVLLLVAARWRERSLHDHATSSPALLPVLGALVVFFAEVFTFSRGGTMLLGGYLLAAGVAFLVHRTLTGFQSSMPRAVTFTVGAMVAFVVIFALAQVNFDRVATRFERFTKTETRDVSQRLDLYEAGRDMLSNTWPRGVGAGGFRYLFADYIRRYEASNRFSWSHAHNDYLQLPIEQGAVGSALVLAGGSWWLWRLWRTRVWRSLPTLLLALGLFQTLAHASFDFPFQNPAILITWLVLALVAVRYAAPDGGGRTADGG